MSSLPAAALAIGPSLMATLFPADLLDRLRRSAVLGDIEAAELLLTGWDSPVLDEPFLERAPRLRAVFHAGGTVKRHVTDAVFDRGIVVSSAAAANATPVAQYTVAAILLAGKRAFRLANQYRADPARRPVCPNTGNHRRTVGVIAASRVGRLVLSQLAQHGFRLLLSDPTLAQADVATVVPGARVELVDIDELVRRSDVVTVHAPALPETRHLLDERRLSLLRDGAIVVNTARGSLVDTDALARQCGTGRIDAVLDVTEPEPLPAGHPLLAMPNVFLTNHIAGATGNEIRMLAEFAVAEVERFIRGLPLAGQVTAADLAQIA